ncbi:MAG: hypothetical protein P4K80_07960 [Acidobacteriaceae bacterium]|nr:hypothetical protein [Acidobacteriaceae bacterium]
MHIDHRLFAMAGRAAAFSFVMAGTALLAQAQQTSSAASTTAAPVLMASADLLSSAYSSSSSSSSSLDADGSQRFNLDSVAQPPRRSYGRPTYSSGNTNRDGSNKYTFMAGVGLDAPVGNTHIYDTPSYSFQFGGGRNFNRVVGLLAQFDYDNFGLQAKTLNNQSILYFGATGQGLDGNSHIWSFTLNPTFTLPTEGPLGLYAVLGGGFYHKVTNFTLPSVQCDYYSCYSANQNVDMYTSNSLGVNGGIGITYKFSKFSNERFYVETRYVFLDNQQRYGVTANSSTAVLNAYNGYNYYPANSNRTTYIPIKFGIRF